MADAKEYDALCRKMARRYLRLAYSVCGTVLSEEDLLMEARMAVVEALNHYKHTQVAERIWVRTRVKHRLVDVIRRFNIRTRDEIKAIKANVENVATAFAARRRVFSLDEMYADTGSFRIPTAFMAPDEQVILSNQRDILEQGLNQLPERQRTAIELGYLNDKRITEIAEIMGISESRVCQLQKKAIGSLRKWFTDADELCSF